MEKVQSVDEYISAFPADVQHVLQRLRAQLLQLVPQAKEKIGYGIPTLTLNGNLIHFAAYKNHIGLYPGSKAIAYFEEELQNYHTSKGTVQFPLHEPIPMHLVEKIVTFCVKQNLSKKKR
ncbi:iron chaperone [Pedobacter sp.]